MADAHERTEDGCAPIGGPLPNLTGGAIATAPDGSFVLVVQDDAGGSYRVAMPAVALAQFAGNVRAAAEAARAKPSPDIGTREQIATSIGLSSSGHSNGDLVLSIQTSGGRPALYRVTSRMLFDVLKVLHTLTAGRQKPKH